MLNPEPSTAEIVLHHLLRGTSSLDFLPFYLLLALLASALATTTAGAEYQPVLTRTSTFANNSCNTITHIRWSTTLRTFFLDFIFRLFWPIFSDVKAFGSLIPEMWCLSVTLPWLWRKLLLTVKIGAPFVNILAR